MSDKLQEAHRAVECWHLGQTSARYESSGQGAGVISTGRGDHGGVSYGAYQLSSSKGTLREYLDQSRYGERFVGLTPTTPAFNAKWKELARTDPGFAQDQHEFIGKSHYGEQVARMRGAGIDLSDRGRAVQDAIWSTSVQFRGLTPRIFSKGLVEKFGEDYQLARLTDKEVIEAVQDYKIAHNASLFKSSPTWHSGLLKRAHAEKAALTQLAVYEEMLVAAGVDIWPHRLGSITGASGIPDSKPDRSTEAASITLELGDKGQRVRSLQERLQSLGYTGLQGRPLKIDSDFGSNTDHAVRAFQSAHGLRVDGIVGDATRAALLQAERAPLLSERGHPQHGLYQQARHGLSALPAGSITGGRAADNTAAALAQRAHASGLARIDHVLVNTRGDGMLAVQGQPTDPARHVAWVDRALAATQPVARSTELLAASDAVRLHASQAEVQMQHQEHRNGLAMAIRP